MTTDFVAYSTKNYQLLTDVWLESLKKVPVPKNIHLRIDEDVPGACVTYAGAIENKIKNLIGHTPSRGTMLIVSSDCDIRFYENGDWEGLVDFIAKSPRKMFFMRDCSPDNVNGGFYIIKRDYFEHYKGFLRRMLKHGISDYYYVDQCYINEHRDELDWDYIPDEYIMCGANWRWDKSRVCLYHAIVNESRTGDSVLDKMACIHRHGPSAYEKKNFISSPKKDEEDCVLVVAKYKENTEWTSMYCKNVIVYDKGPRGTVPNIGREAHTYLTYILENYERLPATVFFSQGWIQDHHPGLADFRDIRPELVPIEKDLDGARCKRLYPREKLDIRSWFKKYVDLDDEIDLNKPVYVWWGAIFPVSRDRILSRPKEYYQFLIKTIPETNNPEVTHYFERSWYYIFNCDFDRERVSSGSVKTGCSP